MEAAEEEPPTEGPYRLVSNEDGEGMREFATLGRAVDAAMRLVRCSIDEDEPAEFEIVRGEATLCALTTFEDRGMI